MSLPYPSVLTPTQQIMPAKVQANMDYLAALETRLAAAEARLIVMAPLVSFREVTLAIGAWNMVDNTTKSVAHSLNAALISAVDVIIHSDIDAFTRQPLYKFGAYYIGTSEILLERTVTPFTNAAYNGSDNRGYVTITYATGLT